MSTNKTKTVKTAIQAYREIKDSLRVEVKISDDEVDRILINRLIGIRNAECNKNKDTSFIDKTLRWFLDASEFEKYVINKKKIKY